MTETETQEVVREPQAPQAGTPRGRSVVGRILRWIGRMLLVVLIGAALGVGIYMGARRLYQDVIAPVQEYGTRLDDLEATLSAVQDEARRARQAEADRAAEWEGRLALQSEQLASLEANLEDLARQLGEVNASLQDLSDRTDDLEAIGPEVSALAGQLTAIEEALAAEEIPAQRVAKQLQLMRVMALLTRSRLWIEQGNYGLASEDIQAALATVEPLMGGEVEDEELVTLRGHLDAALDAVLSSRNLAEEQLELAWKVLLSITEQP